jgi:hypothetical protein
MALLDARISTLRGARDMVITFLDGGRRVPFCWLGDFTSVDGSEGGQTPSKALRISLALHKRYALDWNDEPQESSGHRKE